MKKNLSKLLLAVILSSSLIDTSGVVFAQEKGDTRIEASEVYDLENDENEGVESFEKLENKGIKREESLPSIIKPEVPEKLDLDIDSYESAKREIEKDLKTKIKLPVLIFSNTDEVRGKLAKGVGVAVYKLTKEESAEANFIPSTEKLLTDGKYSISLENGEFALPFKKDNLKEGDKLAVCISYSLKLAGDKLVNKTYVIEGDYVLVKEQKIALGSSLDISKSFLALPKEAKIEELGKLDTSNLGQKEVEVKIAYQNTETELKVPISIVNKETFDLIYRISGRDRFQSNIESIKKSFKGKQASTVIITSGMSFADPLSAGPLAMKLKAPVIFAGKEALSDDALSLINSLNTKNVILIGGKNSLSENIEIQLKNKNLKRIAGKDRYETSKLILEEYGLSKHIIIADGRKFADALSATPLAKKLSCPILLLDGPEMISNSIRKYNDVYIVGGKKSVSDETESKIKKEMKGKKVYRSFGKDRIETAVEVAKLTKFDTNILVNGRSFPDALSSINLLSNGGKNLLLTEKDKITLQVRDLLLNKGLYIIGGYSTISKDILE